MKNTQKKVLDAVDRLMPKGKTPLSEAVSLAAESLKYSSWNAEKKSNDNKKSDRC